MVTRTVDLRSDSVTKPTEAMRAAMANAEVDDDVFGHDPSALRLETEMAKIMGKEAALFVPSGTMSNLISVLVHCSIRGSEVILGNKSHIHIYENGGISTIGGVHPRTVKNNEDGTMDIDLIEAAIRDPRGEIVYPTTRLICLENSHTSCGGRCLSVEYTDRVGELAKKHGLKLHIDGARIFNASVVSQRIFNMLIYEYCSKSICKLKFSVSDSKILISQALGVPVSRLVQDADSVSVCLSKGLGAPVGSVIVGSKSFVAKARILRKTLGGGMRQVGVLCAAALVAVQENVSKLEDDHKKAKMLAEGLNRIKGLRVNVAAVETNIVSTFIAKVLKCASHSSSLQLGLESSFFLWLPYVYFDVVEGAAEKLCKNLEQHGILIMQESPISIRVALHHQISASDVQYSLSCFKQALTGEVQEDNGI
ncbi:hypothetical protein POTOM_044009 [Populus tomentosa]|uniref:Aromatic amino acid beta-eliminating lyase/threonine aldolase domain-containing protein n=1 Tax=Populus tomentosa TaxID=118781 RepID=A0A8X7YMK7_POPTO|nr:hypothetical protein POTOM_044009 [Populus tomentosa]